MNKVVCVLVFFMGIISVTAQDYKQEIESEFSEYLKSLINKDFDKSIDYILPAFFEIVSKEQMVQLMEQTFNNPEMEIVLKDPKVLQVRDVQVIDDSYYALLFYSNIMCIKFIDDQEQSQEYANAIKQSFGVENVKYDEKTNSFEVYSVKQVCAISENGKVDWKFLVLEKDQKAILKKILPQAIIQRI